MPSPKTCVVCGMVYQPRSWNSKMTPICSEQCKAVRREEQRKKVVMNCAHCGAVVVCTGRNGLAQARRGRAYCSEECKRLYQAKLNAERMARTNRKYASGRMKKRNPMADPKTRRKVSQTLKRIGHRPPVRRGNGTGPTIPQERLAAALGWPVEVAIRTRVPKGLGYPTCYKVDIGSRKHKVAIDVDGNSHSTRARQAQDRKKDELLRGLGWTVLRFSNGQVMLDLGECVRTVMFTISKSRRTTTTMPRES